MGFWSKLGRAFVGESVAEGKALASRPAKSGAATPQDLFIESVARQAVELPQIERFERSTDARLQARAWLAGHSEPTLMNLDRLFQDTRELDPDARSRAVLRFLGSISSEREELTWDEVQTRLVPVLRASGFAAGHALELVWRAFQPFVRFFVGIDRDDSTSFVSEAQLKTWGQTPDLVFALATETLARHVSDRDVEPYDSDPNGGFWHVTANDSYEPSRLALPGYLASFRSRVAGNPIAIMPDRARLLIAGDANPALVARIARMAETEFKASTRAVSCAVYTVDAHDAVRPLHLPSDHPHHALVERGHRLLSCSGYADQKRILEQRFEVELTPFFVASLGLVVDKISGHTITWASFAEAVQALLPEADLIALGGGQGERSWTLWIPWHDFFELAPGCLELDPEYDPPRFQTKTWPNATQLAALRAISKRPNV